MSDNNNLTYDEWLAIGKENKFCLTVECETHEGHSFTAEEEKEWNDGGDPCILAIRVFNNPEEYDEVVKNNKHKFA